MPMIEAKNLVKKFGDLVAVSNVNFSVEKGEIFGFLGPNGAGKSTTIQMLATLLKPTSGSAVLNGYDVVHHQDAVRKSIGLVFQDPTLDGNLTAMENLNFHAALYNVDKKLLSGRLDELMHMVELHDRRKDLVKSYSGGMKRRLEIARGLVHHPQVLFLDEPTIGLDPQTRNHIWTYIRDLRKREGITIFLTTHYMDEAENCSRIAIIDHGEIVALDTPEKLKQMIGGDVIDMTVANAGESAQEIEEKFGLKGEVKQDRIRLKVEKGDILIPRILSEISGQVSSVSMRKPTLDDVFLKLTGRAIREESAGSKDMMRAMIRRRFH